jgi:phosphohistidine phosphatase
MPITCDNIILWRHAEAAVSSDSTLQSDMARALTKKGQRQAKQMARWLKAHLPADTLLLSSAALRAFQTAQALNDREVCAKINVHPVLNPAGSVSEILAFLANLKSHKNILLVGHQPYLGRLASQLLGLELSDLNIKKGAIWWLRLEVNQAHLNKPFGYKIVDVQTPNLS